MDLQLIDERIKALTDTKKACTCQSRQACQLRDIADMLIQNYQKLKQELLDALVDGFFTDCDVAKN